LSGSHSIIAVWIVVAGLLAWWAGGTSIGRCTVTRLPK
jgi:hypothetical protein